MLRKLIIGDIHGCYSELLALIELAAISADDQVIGLGDIVDRGPDSGAVLDFFRTRPNTFAICGNHERKHVRWSLGELKPARSQRIVRDQLGPAHDGAVAFMKTFPLYLDLPEAVLVHGFFEPDVPLDSQRVQVICGTLTGEAYMKKHYPDPWYAGYAGQKPLLVGHHDYLHTGQPLISNDRVWGLDTGCCYGGRLTGLLLPEFRVISVPAAKDYWREAKSQYEARHSEIAQPPPEWSQADLALLAAVVAEIRQRHERLVQQIRENEAWDSLTPQQQGAIYAKHAGEGLLASLLHRARTGRLTETAIQQAWQTPRKARQMAGLLDIPPREKT